VQQWKQSSPTDSTLPEALRSKASTWPGRKGMMLAWLGMEWVISVRPGERDEYKTKEPKGVSQAICHGYTGGISLPKKQHKVGPQSPPLLTIDTRS